jgi:hypothetical protein
VSLQLFGLWVGGEKAFPWIRPASLNGFFYLDELFFSIPLEGVYEGLREAVGHNDVQLTAVDEDPVPAVQQLLHKGGSSVIALYSRVRQCRILYVGAAYYSEQFRSTIAGHCLKSGGQALTALIFFSVPT